MSKDKVWQDNRLVQTFLNGVRGGIPFATEQLDIMLRLIEAGGLPVETFADLGCGNGILASSILSKYPKAEGILVDFSGPMLTEAKIRLEKFNSRLSFMMTDLGSKTWVEDIKKHSPFDAVVSGFAIHHQSDERKRELYVEIFDRLKLGGIFINIEHVASPSPWLEMLSDNCLIDSLYDFHQRNGSNRTREQIADEFVHRQDKEANLLSPVEVQCDWLTEIGFRDVDCYFKSFELAIFGGRRMV